MLPPCEGYVALYGTVRHDCVLRYNCCNCCHVPTQDVMEAGSADALRVVADIGDRLGGVEAELHTRLDSELLYTKKKVEQTHDLLSARIDNEVLVLSERVEHLRQGTATIDAGLCRLDSKMDQTAEALNNRIEDNATKLDDQIYSGE